MTRKIVKRSIFFLHFIDLATNSTEKPKIDIYQYFIGVDGLGKDPKQPSIPTTIGAARKAALAKDIDPVVLKVNEQFHRFIHSLKTRFENGEKEKKEISVLYYVHYPTSHGLNAHGMDVKCTN